MSRTTPSSTRNALSHVALRLERYARVDFRHHLCERGCCCPRSRVHGDSGVAVAQCRYGEPAELRCRQLDWLNALRWTAVVRSPETSPRGPSGATKVPSGNHPLSSEGGDSRFEKDQQMSAKGH